MPYLEETYDIVVVRVLRVSSCEANLACRLSLGDHCIYSQCGQYWPDAL